MANYIPTPLAVPFEEESTPYPEEHAPATTLPAGSTPREDYTPGWGLPPDDSEDTPPWGLPPEGLDASHGAYTPEDGETLDPYEDERGGSTLSPSSLPEDYTPGDFLPPVVGIPLTEAEENCNARPMQEYIEYIGPTWEMVTGTSFYKVPPLTLGWECINWVLEHCQAEDASGPFLFTPEQARFILHWYAIDDSGRFLYDEGALQRLKGWGKDPMLCLVSLFEALGNARFAGWSADGKPMSKPVNMPLVQVAAMTQEQTSNTLRYYKVYLTPEAIKKYRIEINTESVKSFGTIVINAVTSNPEALEGKSQTFCIANETQHWHSRIAREMWSVIVRNAVKVRGGTSRILAITNAYDPNLNSVAQQTRETYEAQIAKTGQSRILYDSVEAAPDAPIDTAEQIAELVSLVRGDSDWSNIERIVGEFFDTRNPVDHSRRFWLNTIVSSEENWIDYRDFDKCVNLTNTRIKKNDQIVMFGDFSKSDDSSVLVGCRVSDGFVFKIAAWHKPKRNAGPAGTVWLVPRNERDRARYDFDPALGYPNPYRNVETADEAVERAFKTWNIVGFWADPSHAKDDITHNAYWTEAIERWHVKYSKKLKVWAGGSQGMRSESISWDMADPKKIEQFAEYAERTFESILRHELLIENDPEFREHARNARIYKTREGGTSIWKGKKSSDKKIDLAVGMIGALMVRSKYLKQYGEQKRAYNSYRKFG